MLRYSLVLLVAIAVSTTLPVIRAEIPKHTEDQLMRAASHVFEGAVIQRYGHATKKSGSFEYTFGVAEITVADVQKGSEIAPGNRVFVRYWRKRWIGEGSPPTGHNGHRNIPAPGSVATVFVAGNRNTGFDVLSPNGFFSSKKTVITPTRVGDYVIGKSTQKEILRVSTSSVLVLQERRRFAERGLYFEFNRGKELTGITVTSPEYELANGICVGIPEAQIRKLLGEPRSRKIVANKLRLDALVYDRYTFLLDDEAKVSAIRVGRKHE